MPGVVIVGQVPSIPQSAFADSSLCTREVRWPDGHTVFALARCACLGKESMTAQALGLPSAGAQYDCPGTGPSRRLAEFLFQLGEEGRAEKIHHGDLQAIAQLFQGGDRGAAVRPLTMLLSVDWVTPLRRASWFTVSFFSSHNSSSRSRTA